MAHRCRTGRFAHLHALVTHNSCKKGSKKSPYREDTGVPELLLPRCANGAKSDCHKAGWFPQLINIRNAVLRAGGESLSIR
ncbi:protein of unknown function [Paraburkholderia dioscoreae]|uniref:Uncharacterized protein n=1 Tax=Paraburkholderia dioscoreae TaxID=2604047 RepID=A0A5Q4ZCD5_9BURK|nr:protein of unknown function [Paraburkholderia dioscoreae]